MIDPLVAEAETASGTKDGSRKAPARPKQRLVAALTAIALILTLPLSACNVREAADGIAPNRHAPVDDIEAIAAQSFFELPDGFETLADDASAVSDENGSAPSFTDEDLAYASDNPGFESYSQLDALDRCGAATACLGPETVPSSDESRESISEIEPTGWNQAFYDCVQDEALWNRCHLIAWSLAAENANERNLVTGTRSMNAEAMLPYEKEVARYIDRTGSHVLYRATPVFKGDELVCRGVLLEAESIEDGGQGVEFSVFCANVQPGIAIDYDTGASREENAAPAPTETREYVLNTSSMRFHLPECDSVAAMSANNRAYATENRDELIREGFVPCGNCKP